MISYLFTLLKRLFQWPDLQDIGKGFAKPINNQLSDLERKITWYFIIVVGINILGFLVILSCLEDGFHWKYLFKF